MTVDQAIRFQWNRWSNSSSNNQILTKMSWDSTAALKLAKLANSLFYPHSKCNITSNRVLINGLMICDSRVKFKVSWKNIFQETKKSWIVIISWAWINTKIPQTAPNLCKKWINNKQAMAFWAVKIKFSWSPSMALPWTFCREEITAPTDHSCI